MNEVNFGDNQYCGPAVISAITGLSTDEVAEIIKSSRKRVRPVKGILTTELVDTLQKLGWKTKYIHASRSVYMMLTLNSEPGYYIFAVASHVILIEITADGQRLLVDNHTKQPINAGVSSRLSQRVWQAIKVWKE